MSPDEDFINSENINNDVTLEDCTVSYFAGYLDYKNIKKINCSNCQNKLFIDKNYLVSSLTAVCVP